MSLTKQMTKLLNRHGRYRRVNVVSGVQWNHNDVAASRKYAEERAGASLLGYLYRFEWDRSYERLNLIAYKITKKTPKGWKIYLGGISGTKQIMEGTMRKFAAPTIEAALESYKRRKTSYVHILESHLMQAKQSLEAASLPEAFPKHNPEKKLRYFIGEEEFAS